MKKAESTSKTSVSAISRAVSRAVHHENVSLNEDDPVEGDPNKPSPLELEMFIPWVCRQWNASTSAVITPKLQEDFRKKPDKRALKLDVSCHLEESEFPAPFSKLMELYLVPVIAYYDTKQRLVEIAIEGSAITSRKVIAAFGLCIPYHSSLTRFTYRRSYLTAALIYDINKLLPISSISEIVFDDSDVPEANYYILLEKISQLKYLSLNRCKINNAVCKKIFENIQFNAPAANNLQMLELGSNDITDDAAIFIGSVLRANRRLLHLNLSGNKITDSGFVPILNSLMEFPMNFKEKYDSRRRKFEFLQSKAAVYERCLNNLKCRYAVDLDSASSMGGILEPLTKSTVSPVSAVQLSKSSKIVLKRERSKAKRSKCSLEEEAKTMTEGIIGEFQDPFSPDDVVVKNEVSYSKGNLILCYINIAYNNLANFSVQRLHDVLRYQDGMRVKSQPAFKGKTGLIKITLDGNQVPKTCVPLLGEINSYLNKVIILRTAGSKKLTFRKAQNNSTVLEKISSHKS